MKEKKFDFGSVKKQLINSKQIEGTFSKALKSHDSAIKLKESDPEGSFTMAYESMLKASLALMFSHGYRPRVQLGHHKTLVNFSAYILGSEFDSLTATYDKMRDKRNKIIYDSLSISETEAGKAIDLSAKYIKALSDRMEHENPQIKLFK